MLRSEASTPRLVVLGMLLLFYVLPAGTLAVIAQTAPSKGKPADPPEHWGPFRLLEGTWEGNIDGRLGRGVGRRRYQFIFDGVFLLMRHASVRLPQEKSAAGDYHRELAVYSFDQQRGTIVLREFIVEGYVVQYVCEVESRRFVCTSESVESGPGIRARLTIEIQDRYQMTETFELAVPGEELKPYFNNKWARIPDLHD